MTFKSLNATFPLMALLGALAACGGGGDDEAGSVTPFSVVPSTLTLKASSSSPAGTCGGGYAGEVYVYGGAAPYRLDNTASDIVKLSNMPPPDPAAPPIPFADVTSTNQVGSRGDRFTVWLEGTCVSPGIVVIVDKNDRQVTLTVTNGAAS